MPRSLAPAKARIAAASRVRFARLRAKFDERKARRDACRAGLITQTWARSNRSAAGLGSRTQRRNALRL